MASAVGDANTVWNPRPDRLGVVERAVLGGLAERAHSYGCPVHLSIPTAQEQWHTVSATRRSLRQPEDYVDSAA